MAFEIGEQVACGVYAEVRRCVHRESGIEYACKRARKCDAVGVAMLCLEVAFLSSRLQGHPNVVSLHSYDEDEEFMNAYLEFCGGGNLFERLEEIRTTRSIGLHQRVLTEAEAGEAFLAIAKGLAFCHAHYVMHRDIKPENILLPRRGGPLSDLKLADFGGAADFCEVEFFNGSHGTELYQAPEILQRRPYDEKVDIWSMGVILYILLFNDHPFKGSSSFAIHHSIRTRLYIITQSKLTISDNARDLLINLLQPNPCKRMTLSSILTHSWLSPIPYFKHITLEGYAVNAVELENHVEVDESEVEKHCGVPLLGHYQSTKLFTKEANHQNGLLRHLIVLFDRKSSPDSSSLLEDQASNGTEDHTYRKLDSGDHEDTQTSLCIRLRTFCACFAKRICG